MLSRGLNDQHAHCQVARHLIHTKTTEATISIEITVQFLTIASIIKMNIENPLHFMVPLVQPFDKPADDLRFGRPFFDKPSMGLTVFYAIVEPSQNIYLTQENFHHLQIESANLEATCMANWLRDHSDLEWQSLELPNAMPVMAARTASDNMAAILLSNGHLKGFHKHFGEKNLFVGIPDRFTVMVHSCALSLGGIVQGMYDDAVEIGTQFSSKLFCSIDGVIVGTCETTLSTVQGIALIEKMIAHIFLLVSSADGKVDKKELEQFLKTIVKFASSGHSMVHQASHSLLENDLAPVIELMPTITVKGGISFIQESAQKLKRSFSVEEYAQVEQALNGLAKTIATASGSLFSRSKVSEEEAVALFLIAGALA